MPEHSIPNQFNYDPSPIIRASAVHARDEARKRAMAEVINIVTLACFIIAGGCFAAWIGLHLGFIVAAWAAQ